MSRAARVLGSVLGFVLGSWCVAFVIGAAPVGAVLRDGQWIRPVDGAVVRGFDPPDTAFGPGHLGVDFAAAPGTPVRAAGDGVVVFAGRVGASLHVVTRHPGDIRTSDSFLASISVVTGQAVRRGAVLGTSGGTGAGHGAGVLHFGARVGAAYIDPMLLFAAPDLAAVVHLADPRRGAAPDPAPGGAALAERAALAAELTIDGRTIAAPPAWWNGALPPAGPRRAGPAAPAARAGPTAAAIAVRPATRSSGAVPVLVGVPVVAAGAGVAMGRQRRRRGPGR